MESNDRLEYALYYASRGWPVVAIHWPLDNGHCSCGAPECGSIGKHPHGRCCPQGANSAVTDEATIRRWWSDFPDLNVGIALDHHRFVIDIDPRNGGDSTWEDIQGEISLEDGPVCLSGGGGQHIFGRSSTPLRGGHLGQGIDFKAGPGALVVAAPSRHVSGRNYEWELSSQPDMPLPEATEALLRKFATNPKGSKVINLDLSRIRLEPEIKEVGQGSRNTELSRLIGRWVAKGMKPDEVDILARGANDKYRPPLPLDEVRGIVQSMYDTDARNNPEKYAALQVECEQEAALPAGAFPSELLQPGGLMQSLMQYIEEASAVSHPIYALAGAMTLVGSVAGQRVMTESGLRTHTYSLILGYSGSGKNSPQIALPGLCMAAPELVSLNGPNEMTSSAAMLRHLESSPVTHCFVDEIGHLFAAMQNQQSHLADLSGTLMKVWSMAATTYTKPYSDSKQTIVIKYPHLSLLGCSTPSKFWASVTTQDYTMGLMSRVLIWPSEHHGQKPRRNIRQEVDLNLVAQLSEIRGIRPLPVPGANLESRPNVVRLSPKAAALMDEAEDGWMALNEEHRADDVLSAIYSRCAEHAKKCALIHAVSLQGAEVVNGTVGEESVRWAVLLIQHLTDMHISRMRENVSEGSWHAIQQRIVRLLRKKRTPQKPGVTQRDIARGLPNVKGFELKSAIADLVAKGGYVFQPWKGGNGFVSEILIELVDKEASKFF